MLETIEYPFGQITWDSDGPYDSIFIEGTHKLYGKTELKILQSASGHVYERIFFENPPTDFEREDGISEHNIDLYFRFPR